MVVVVIVDPFILLNIIELTEISGASNVTDVNVLAYIVENGMVEVYSMSGFAFTPARVENNVEVP